MWVERTQKGNFKFVEGYKDPNTGKTKRVSVTYEKNTSATRKQALKELSNRIAKAMGKGSHTTYNEAVEVYLKSIDIKPTTLKLKRNTYLCTLYERNACVCVLFHGKRPFIALHSY